MDQIDGRKLGSLRIGERARVVRITGQTKAVKGKHHESDDLERLLLEMGFVEGDEVEVLHHGPWGHDPIAVRLGNNLVVALRRQEADAVIVEL